MSGLIIGCGYLGLRVARHWRAAGRTVFAVTHRPQRAEQLSREGLRPILADVTQPETLAGLPAVDTVLYALGYDRRGTASRRQVHVDGLRTVLDVLPREIGRIIYTSSTGVYGQTGGGWVDEDSPCRPTREGGRIMLAAEEVLRNHPLGDRAIVLRLAGLYGPGRIPRLADLLSRRPVAAPAAGHLNLIHVEDAVRVVLAAETRARPPRTYVVSDGHPTRRRELYLHLAELLGLAAPEFVQPPAGAPSARRATADKRAGNARLLAELGVRLKYPSYREGLAAIVATLK